jgi:PAS domain S-box-containing protein
MRTPDELALIASIADELPCGVWVSTAPEGRFVYANRAFEDIVGMGPVSVAKAGDYAAAYGFFDREGRQYAEVELPFARALQERATVNVDDIVIHRRDGRRVQVRAVGKPMFDAEGGITHVAVVFFDITREVEPLPAALPIAGSPAAAAAPAARATVLVVDDEPLILKVMAQMLGREHDVTCESSGHAALERIRRGERYDAIMCDLMMPQVTGMDLYDAVLEIAPKQAQSMLFLTGGAFTARARAFLERVPDAMIEKPFDAATLLARIRRLVG